ncbi:MAG TPA: amidase, partial [Ktedonobacteraceae bacterium]|nr:amidase [Ktedonobacteraceae bacterium]
MYTASFPLANTLEALRSGELELSAYINEVCVRIEAAEPHIEALLPEANRHARLLKDAEDLRIRFPDPATRPVLYGVLLGVKDIFSVDGF